MTTPGGDAGGGGAASGAAVSVAASASATDPFLGARPPARYPLIWWDTGVVTVLVIMMVVGIAEVLSGGVVGFGVTGIGSGLAATLGALLLFAVAYLVLGRPALRRAAFDAPATRADFWFLASLVVILALATVVNGSFASLQVLGYPMIWNCVARYWSAVQWSGVLAVAVGFGALARGGLFGGLFGVSIMTILSFAFAVAMGTWITRIFERGDEYRILADRLRASQEEVAALSSEAGAAAERERLSRELHDTLTQTLTGLVMFSEQADRALAAGDQPRAQDRLGRVRSAARESLEEARALVASTQPLGDGGLEAAISRVVARFRGDTDLDVTCNLETVALDRERQVMLLRATQEGLANARKHACASRVSVVLLTEVGSQGSVGSARSEEPRGDVILRVDDDGIGPDPERVRAGGFGLTGLADRMRAVGGSVRFDPGPNGGARLEVRLPVGASVEQLSRAVTGGNG